MTDYARRGVELHALGDLRGAAAAFERAVALVPDDRTSRFNLGVVEDELGRACVERGEFEEAERHFRAASTWIPDRADPLANLAFLYHALGRIDDAIAASNAAIALEPAHVQSHVNLALTYLLAGDYPRGFREYEYRPTATQIPGIARWDGSPLDGKRVLVSREQGLGDFILYSRFFAPLAARGARLSVEVPGALRALYDGFPGIDELLDEGKIGDPARYAASLPIASIPAVLRLDAASISANVPYLRVGPAAIARFADALATAGDRLRVGIAWAGSPGHARDRHRSASLAHFSALAGEPNVAWFSLQKGPAAAQAAHPPDGLEVISLEDRLTTLEDTAAAICALDLVICVDTSIAHLAGALGKQVWLLNGFGNYWVWGLRRERTPWYPTMRLFHQDAPGDWASLFRHVRAALRDRRQAPGA